MESENIDFSVEGHNELSKDEDDFEDQQIEEHRKAELANEMMNAFDDLEDSEEESLSTGCFSREESYRSNNHVSLHTTQDGSRLKDFGEEPKQISVIQGEDHPPCPQQISGTWEAGESRADENDHWNPNSEEKDFDSLDEKYLRSTTGSKEHMQILYDARGREIQRLTEALSSLQQTSERHVRVLKHQIGLLKTDKAELKGKLKKMQETLVLMNTNTNQFEETVSRLSMKISELEAENTKERCDEAEKTVKILEEELSKANCNKGLNLVIEREMESTVTANNEVEKEKKSLIAEKNELKFTLEKKDDYISMLEKELNDAKSLCEQIKIEHETRCAELTQLLAHERQSSVVAKNNFQTKIDKLDDDNRRLFEELEKLEAEKADLESGFKLRTQDIRNCSEVDKGIISASLNDVEDSELRETFKQSVFVSKQLRMKVEKLENEIREKQVELKEAIENAQKEKSEKESLQRKTREIDGELNYLKKKIQCDESVAQEKKISEEVCQSLQSQLDAAQKKVSDEEVEKEHWKLMVENLRDEITNLKDANENLKSQIEQFQRNLMTVHGEKCKLEDYAKELQEKLRSSEELFSKRIENDLLKQKESLKQEHLKSLENLRKSFEADKNMLREQIKAAEKHHQQEVEVAVRNALSRVELDSIESAQPREQGERNTSNLDEKKKSADNIRKERDKYIEEIEKLKKKMMEDRKLIKTKWKEERDKLLNNYGKLLSEQEEKIRNRITKENEVRIEELVNTEKSRLHAQVTKEITTYHEKEEKYKSNVKDLEGKVESLQGQVKDKDRAVQNLVAKLEEWRKAWELEKEALLENCKTPIPDLVRKIGDNSPAINLPGSYGVIKEEVDRLKAELSKRENEIQDLKTSIKAMIERHRTEVKFVKETLEESKQYGKEQREKYVQLKKKSIKYQEYILNKMKTKGTISKEEMASKEFLKGILTKISSELSSNEASSTLFPNPSIYRKSTLKLTPRRENDGSSLYDDVFATDDKIGGKT
ncbi:centrosomal protein of 152 kDa-like isoform X2 [Artemia franciscana]|uniref:centrosomal protein of 152 kDa-like isoform X2 n=1 Tax=Artemia franciscana TaxID=6661 RepID=UPI0032DAD8FF